MGWHTGHYSQARGLGKDGQLPVREHPGVHPAQGGDAQKAILMASDNKTNLVQVGVQQQPGGVLLPAAAQSHHAAHPVHFGLVGQGAQQLRSLPGHRSLKAAGPGQGTQAAQYSFVIQGYPSEVTGR